MFVVVEISFHPLFLRAVIVAIISLPAIFASALKLKRTNTHLIQTPGYVIKFSYHHRHHDKLTKTQSRCLALQTSWKGVQKCVSDCRTQVHVTYIHTELWCSRSNWTFACDAVLSLVFEWWNLSFLSEEKTIHWSTMVIKYQGHAELQLIYLKLGLGPNMAGDLYWLLSWLPKKPLNNKTWIQCDFKAQVWWFFFFFYCQPIPWKDQNQQWINPTTNKFCLAAKVCTKLRYNNL